MSPTGVSFSILTRYACRLLAHLRAFAPCAAPGESADGAINACAHNQTKQDKVAEIPLAQCRVQSEKVNDGRLQAGCDFAYGIRASGPRIKDRLFAADSSDERDAWVAAFQGAPPPPCVAQASDPAVMVPPPPPPPCQGGGGGLLSALSSGMWKQTDLWGQEEADDEDEVDEEGLTNSFFKRRPPKTMGTPLAPSVVASPGFTRCCLLCLSLIPT